VTGASSNTTGATDWDMYTVAYDPSTGHKLWERFYDGSGGAGQEYGYSVAVGPDSKSVYVAGTVFGDGTSTDYATIAYGVS